MNEKERKEMKSAKRRMGLWMALGIATLLPFSPAHGETATVDGKTWIYTVEDGKATVTGVDPAKGVLTIPSKLGGHAVTHIGYKAFFHETSITAVTIPDSVQDIAEAAFCSCYGLQSVTIGNNVTNLGYEAFCECKALSAVTFGQRVSTIGEYAFCDCPKLAVVTLPDSVTDIEYGAFSGCTGLKSVKLGNKIKALEGTFERCSRLSSLDIPNSVTNIDVGAFEGCTGSPLSRFLKKAGKTVMTSRFTPGSQNWEENKLMDNYYSAFCDAVDVCHANMFQVP